jgi:hypothetical protein
MDWVVHSAQHTGNCFGTRKKTEVTDFDGNDGAAPHAANNRSISVNSVSFRVPNCWGIPRQFFETSSKASALVTDGAVHRAQHTGNCFGTRKKTDVTDFDGNDGLHRTSPITVQFPSTP